MKDRESTAPIWLFSFVDLTLLLLIAFTQITYDRLPLELEVGEIQLPRLQTSEGDDLADSAELGWQLRIHPRLAVGAAVLPPFELVKGDAAPEDGGEDILRLTGAELSASLASLRAARDAKPVLVPDRDSRSEDLLVAVGLLDQHWRSGRGVAVKFPPSVSAAPGAATRTFAANANR